MRLAECYKITAISTAQSVQRQPSGVIDLSAAPLWVGEAGAVEEPPVVAVPIAVPVAVPVAVLVVLVAVAALPATLDIIYISPDASEVIKIRP